MPALPLFPLGTVLLPGAALPLIVFEPRYVALLADLNASAPRGQRAFGVVAIRKGSEVGAGAAAELFDVGCEAVIEQVTGTEPPFHVIARGRRRFRITGRDESAGTAYLTGRVTWMDPLARRTGADPEGGAAALADRVRSAHTRLLAAMGATTREVGQAGTDELAYRVVERSALELADRQAVLEGRTERDRLATLLAILRRELALVSQVRAVPGRIDPGAFSPN
ncbi:MAG: LON peptidase substrate-binding domain-containing protein [Intrasporangium sp.]|uniref:LON peptidase substrate-binding domain-containing protein n=1 Tax=Intrasporangium sp. TaxID=1925024 RepID=UPI002649E141|nr:LON peptidase substrate-binding domain-containing protein [Intrasporangium sp.]MDN5797390.1 LON peptidase substrate-binding domain-containing protein [Intrasporangium sp.]